MTPFFPYHDAPFCCRSPCCSPAASRPHSVGRTAGRPVGVINLVNTTDSPCVRVRLLRADGTALAVAQVRDGVPGAHRVDVVQPGGTAVSHVFGMNGCRLGGRASSVDVRWPGGHVPVTIAEGRPPRCDAPGPGRPSRSPASSTAG